MKEAVFYVLYMGEEPDSQATADKAVSILESFPNGFEVLSYEVIEDTDYIDAKFVPYKQSDFQADMYTEMFNGWIIEVKKLSDKRIAYRYKHATEEPTEVKETDIRINGAGLPDFITGTGSVIPLWSGKSTVWKSY